MRLDLSEQVVAAQASESDVAKAIAQGPRDEGWSLLLEEGDDFLLAEPAGDRNKLDLQCGYGPEMLKARDVLSDAQLRDLFVSFLNRDGQWRGRCRWVAMTDEAVDEPADHPPAAPRSGAFLFAVLGFVALIVLTVLFPGHWIPGWLPPVLQDRGAWILVWIGFAVAAALGMARRRGLHNKPERIRWAQTTGKITRSDAIAEERSVVGEALQVVNLPAVRYSYEVDGKPYTGDRISLDDIGDDDPRTTDILQRYRPGTSVTVYYRPDQPENSVLECEPVTPPATPHSALWVSAPYLGLMLAALACWALFPVQIKAWWSTLSHPYLFLFFAFNAGFSLLSALAMQTRSRLNDEWAVTLGKVLVSRVELRDARSRERSEHCYARLEYSYSVGGREYRGSRIRMDVDVSGSESVVRAMIDRYPVGRSVSVYYNRKNPAKAALNPGYNHLAKGLIAAVICGLLAWYFGTP